MLPAFASAALVLAGRRRSERTLAALIVVWIAVWIVTVFAYIYYVLEPASWNPHHQLSHFEALYVAVGTLTTAGSGISPVGEEATIALTVQMILDLLIITFVAGLVVTRLSERSQRSPERPPPRRSSRRRFVR